MTTTFKNPVIHGHSSQMISPSSNFSVHWRNYLEIIFPRLAMCHSSVKRRMQEIKYNIGTHCSFSPYLIASIKRWRNHVVV